MAKELPAAPEDINTISREAWDLLRDKVNRSDNLRATPPLNLTQGAGGAMLSVTKVPVCRPGIIVCPPDGKPALSPPMCYVLHQLRDTLPVNVATAEASGWGVEIVLIDYNSGDGLEAWVRENMATEVRAGLLRVFRTGRPPTYDSSHAKNVAHRQCRGSIVCNLDADNFVSPEWLTFIFETFGREPRSIVRPADSPSGVNGRLALPWCDFAAMGGYDESFVGYGYDDAADLFARAVASGLRPTQPSSQFTTAIAHPDAERVAAFPSGYKDKGATEATHRVASRRNVATGRLAANAGRDWGSEVLVPLILRPE